MFCVVQVVVLVAVKCQKIIFFDILSGESCWAESEHQMPISQSPKMPYVRRGRVPGVSWGDGMLVR